MKTEEEILTLYPDQTTEVDLVADIPVVLSLTLTTDKSQATVRYAFQHKETPYFGDLRVLGSSGLKWGSPLVSGTYTRHAFKLNFPMNSGIFINSTQYIQLQASADAIVAI